MKVLSGIISVVIHILAVVVGIYAILSLFELVPSFKILFSDEPAAYVKFLKTILFVFVPIGIVLFINQMLFGESIVTKVITFVGLALLVVPSLIFHIQLMSSVSAGSFTADYTIGQVDHEYVGLFLIFPVICLYIAMTFQLIGKDQFVIHGDYDDATDNAGWVLPYIYVCGGNSLVMVFLGSIGNLGFFSVLTLVVGCIALAIMGISRLKNGSPFAY